MIKAKFKFALNQLKLMEAIDRKRAKVLARTGAFGMTVMRRSIRPPSNAKKNRSVTLGGRLVIVPVRGKVIDAKTKQPIRTEDAKQARLMLAAKLRGSGEGQPPRRGPKDLLRKFILFTVDPKSQSVVIGAAPFAKQPSLLGATTVPELLNYGGGQNTGGVLVKYGARPFVEPALATTLRKMEQEIERVPL